MWFSGYGLNCFKQINLQDSLKCNYYLKEEENHIKKSVATSFVLYCDAKHSDILRGLIHDCCDLIFLFLLALSLSRLFVELSDKPVHRTMFWESFQIYGIRVTGKHICKSQISILDTFIHVLPY